MSEITVEAACGTTKDFDARSEAEDGIDTHLALCEECTEDDIVAYKGDRPDDLDAVRDGGPAVVEETTQLETAEHDNRPAEPPTTDTTTEPTNDTAPETTDEPDDAPDTIDPEALSKNPIDFLESVNDAFVNYIRGTPAISKRGFRFIQREFEISTESEVVQWSEDPLGCVVWAKAELPGGHSAEAHGEGYQFESDVSDNEFVRYADSRAKSRALSDLTAGGAMAVEELTGSNADTTK